MTIPAMRMAPLKSPGVVFGKPPALQEQERMPVKAPDEWEPWVKSLFPEYVRAPFAPHHRDFWEWLWGIRKGVPAQPFVGIWARGGGKSTNVELGCVAIGARETRGYAWYISGTQAQADEHVGNVGTMLESDAVGQAYPNVGKRLVNKFGQVRGWRRNRLRTAAGFTIDALGLDTAARGMKIDNQRPDFIVFDDVDGEKDTLETTAKKRMTITRTLLPAGSNDCIVVGIQNLVGKASLFSELSKPATEGGADYLADRIISGPFPALLDFKFEQTDGRFYITSGIPVWEGQNLEDCQRQITRFGITAFQAESQHDLRVLRAGLALPEFSPTKVTLSGREVPYHVIPAGPLPQHWRRAGGHDWGYRAYCITLWAAYDPEGGLIIYRELVGRGWHPDEIAKRILQVQGGDNVPVIWAGHDVVSEHRSRLSQEQELLLEEKNAMQMSVLSQYRRAGLTTMQLSTSIERMPGLQRIHQVLDPRPEPVIMGRNGVPLVDPESVGTPWLRIMDSCPHLIECLENLEVHPLRLEDVKDDYPADAALRDDDYDAIRYLVMSAGALGMQVVVDDDDRPFKRRKGW